MSFSIYTPGAMGSSPIYSVTGSQTGHEGKYLGDFNPMTYWWYDSLSTVDIKIGCAAGITNYAIQGLLLVLTNWEDITAGYIAAAWSDDGSTFTTISGASIDLGYVATPMRLIDLGAAYNHRYWRLRITDQNVAVKASLAMALRKWTISRNFNYPTEESPEFNTRIQEGPGGHIFTTQYNTTSRLNINRSYYSDGDTDKDAIVDAHADCAGAFRPCVLQEGTSSLTARLVRFPDKPTVIPIQYQQYQITIPFVEVRLLPSGEAY